MKWLLVTTNPAPFVPGSAHPHGAGWNVGDQFALAGVERIVWEVDPAAQIELLNVDLPDLATPRDFDRAIFAGRTMFWPGAPAHPLWVHLLEGWLCRDPRKVLALGVGDVFPLDAARTELEEQIERARRRVFRLVLRANHLGELPWEGVEVSVCPGAWAILDRDVEPTLKLCNMMVGGAHYPNFSPREAEKWREIEAHVAGFLRAEGFGFVAHTNAEAELAARLGWPSKSILTASTANGYLRIYAETRCYIGNRMHGAIVLAGRRAVATAVGWDSRLLAADRAGAYVSTPSLLSPPALAAFARLEPGRAEEERVEEIRAQRKAIFNLVRDFAS